MILIVGSNYAFAEKDSSVFFFYRLHTSPNSRFHSYLKSTGSSRSVSALLSPFSFPNRSTTSNFSSLHNSSFTDHFSTTSHQPFPPCKFTFRFFFLFLFSPFSFVQKLTGHPSSPRFTAIDPWILLFRPRILSRRSTEHKKQLAPSEVEPCTGNKISKQIDRRSRVNK